MAVTKPTKDRGEDKQSWDIYSRYSDKKDKINNKKPCRKNREQWILMKMKTSLKQKQGSWVDNFCCSWRKSTPETLSHVALCYVSFYHLSPQCIFQRERKSSHRVALCPQVAQCWLNPEGWSWGGMYPRQAEVLFLLSGEEDDEDEMGSNGLLFCDSPLGLFTPPALLQCAERDSPAPPVSACSGPCQPPWAYWCVIYLCVTLNSDAIHTTHLASKRNQMKWISAARS